MPIAEEVESAFVNLKDLVARVLPIGKLVLRLLLKACNWFNGPQLDLTGVPLLCERIFVFEFIGGLDLNLLALGPLREHVGLRSHVSVNRLAVLDAVLVLHYGLDPYVGRRLQEDGAHLLVLGLNFILNKADWVLNLEIVEVFVRDGVDGVLAQKALMKLHDALTALVVQLIVAT